MACSLIPFLTVKLAGHVRAGVSTYIPLSILSIFPLSLTTEYILSLDKVSEGQKKKKMEEKKRVAVRMRAERYLLL